MAQIKTRSARQHQIEDKKRGFPAENAGSDLVAVSHFADSVASPLQITPDQPQHRGLIFRNQNFAFDAH
jgi:hypothetical protein